MLVPEVVSIIITHWSEKWNPKLFSWNGAHKRENYDLLDCCGLLGDVHRRSLSQFAMHLTDFDGQSVKNGQTFAQVWGRYFAVDSPMPRDCCRFLRSLEIELEVDIDIDVPSLNLVFASCRDMLEELQIHFYIRAPFNLMFPSIVAHCHSLHTLSLLGCPVEYVDVPCLPLFRGIGGRLRRLKIFDVDLEFFSSIWQYCTVLEELEVNSDDGLSFAAELRTSLKVITLHHTPPDKLIALAQLVPDVHIHLSGFPNYDELQDVIRICGKQLRTLGCVQLGKHGVLPCDFEKLCGSLINLEVFRLGTNEGMKFMEPFYVTPKPYLRELVIFGGVDAGVFDFLAMKLSTLERLEVGVNISTNHLNGTELTNLFTTNKYLKRLCIRVLTTRNASVLSLRASFTRSTALLIRSLKDCNALRKFKLEPVDFIYGISDGEEVIADACVGLRGRRIDIKVGDVQYLKKGLSMTKDMKLAVAHRTRR